MFEISGRHTSSSLAEEEQFSDLLLLMKMLTNILSKDFIEFITSSDAGTDKVSAADLTLYGLNIVIPLMSSEILKVCNIFNPVVNPFSP